MLPQHLNPSFEEQGGNTDYAQGLSKPANQMSSQESPFLTLGKSLILL